MRCYTPKISPVKLRVVLSTKSANTSTAHKANSPADYHLWKSYQSVSVASAVSSQGGNALWITAEQPTVLPVTSEGSSLLKATAANDSGDSVW